MKFTFVATFIVAFLLLNSIANAKSAYPNGVDLAAKSLYGTTASYTFSCAGCHNSGGYDITGNGTQFGKDFFNSAVGKGFSPTNLTDAQIKTIISAIGLTDSDKDTFTNEKELAAGTNPASALSKPTVVTCTRSNPALTITPTTQSGLAGAKLSYTLGLTNKDSAGCTGSTFNLTPNLPTGLSATLSMQSVVLTPGQATNVTLSVTSLATSTPSNYNFSVAAINAASPTFTATVNGTYVVMAPTLVCTRAAPLLSIAPSTQSDFAGATLLYKVSLTNKDSVDCAPSTLTLGTTLSSMLQGKLSATTATLSPGQATTVDLSVMSALNAPPSSYTFTVMAADALVALHTAQATGTYVVKSAADTTAPTAPANVRATPVKHSYLISWTASTDTGGIAKYSVYVDGVLKAETTLTSLKIRVRRGPHDITVTATDTSGNLSLPSTAVTVGQ